MSASRRSCASARCTTSGPIPRGSPRVTAMRGRRRRALEPDVDVGRAAQQIEVVAYRELLAQRLADAVLHILERQLALGEALRHLEHHKLGPARVSAHLEHRLEPEEDRKSTRLNSSHITISYAIFC